MSPFNEKYNLIEDYLHGHLSGDKLKEFEARLLTDQEFASEVRMHQLAEEVIVDYKLNDLRNELKEIASKEKPNPWKLYSFSALIITIGIGILVYIGYTIKKELVVENQNAVSNSSNKLIHSSIEQKNNLSQVTIPAKHKTKVNNFIQPNDSKVNSKESILFTEVKDSITSSEINSSNNNSNVPNKGLKVIESISESYKANPCEKVTIESIVQTKPTCKEEEAGELIVDSYSIKGGTAPYTFSINENDYQLNTYFSRLPSGLYTLSIKDASNCIASKEVTIEQTDCKSEYAFNPSQGEVWNIPVVDESEQSIKITDQAGRLVFNKQLINGGLNTWDGQSNNSQDLPMGNYSFVITGKNGKAKLGYVTIFR